MPRLSRSLTAALAKTAKDRRLRIELARARRDMSASLFAERFGIDPKILGRLEAGDPNVSFGSYLKALRVLRLENDIDRVASEDTLGQKLQDARALRTRGRKTQPT